jgi:cation diffusion facilitator CzcD-associated flavoprotein CzcO
MTRRIAVIGAGAAGLCAAKHLKAKGFEVTIFELGSRVGGLWVYGNDNGTSPAYASLHCNSEARVTAYRDFPFPLNAPLYPDHRQMTAYFEAYAANFGLLKRTRFRSEVVNVGKANDWWTVALRDGVGHRRLGYQSVPRHPPFATGSSPSARSRRRGTASSRYRPARRGNGNSSAPGSRSSA